MYEGACKLMAKQKVALDCLSYHAAANDDDTHALAMTVVPKATEFKLDRLVRAFKVILKYLYIIIKIRE